MSYSKITLRYAAAFFDLAEENKSLEKISADMAVLKSICHSNRDFINMLENPVISADRKKKAIHKIFGDSFQALTLRFIDLMIRKRREKYLPLIADAFDDLYNESLGIKTAFVTSAIALEEKEKAPVLSILKRITDKKINLIESVNEKLIGGFIINIDDFQIDQSLANKIKELKKDFEKNLFVKGF